MESIENVIELLRQKRTIREEQFADEERKQIMEYNNLINALRIVKDERNDCKQNINKNLQHLTTHKHSIHKLICDSKNISGLPVSHDYHRQAITFLSEGTDFINKSQNVYKNLNHDNKKSDSESLYHNITSCTNSVESEFYKIKSLISEIKTLQKNVDILQEYCSVNGDIDMEI